MKVYEGEEHEDRHGRYPLVFTGFKKLEEIHDYLFKHYYGYKFAIVFDETHDEWEPYGSEARVYFLDEVLEEAMLYAGKDTTIQMVKRLFKEQMTEDTNEQM